MHEPFFFLFLCTGANAQGQRACDWWQRNGKENAAKIFLKKKWKTKQHLTQESQQLCISDHMMALLSIRKNKKQYIFMHNGIEFITK